MLTSIGLSLAWSVLVIAAARLINFDEPYLSFAVAGGLAFFLRCRPSRWEIYIWLPVSAILLEIIHPPSVPFWVLRVGSGLAVLGLGALHLLGLRLLWSDRKDRENARVLLVPALVLISLMLATAWALRWTGVLNPKTDDGWLYAFDGSLGFQPSFVIGQVMYRSLFLTRLTLLTYLSLPFAMAAVCAWRIPIGTTKASWHTLAVLLLAGGVGGVLYNVVPATGPLYAFAHDFPWHYVPYKDLGSFALEKMPIPAGIPRNGMPSLHVAWVILLCWNSRKLPAWFRVAMVSYALTTVVATLGSGQHYLMDLVVSVPFALAVQAGASRMFYRRRLAASLVIGTGLTFAWLILIRFGVHWMFASPLLPWTLVVSSTTLSFWLEAQGASGNRSAEGTNTHPASLQAQSAAIGKV